MEEVNRASESKFEKYRKRFDSCLSKLIDDVTLADLNNVELSDAAKWVRAMIEYNLKGGKRNRGLMVVVCLDHLKKGQLSEEDISKALILGWCVEWLQSFFLVADDIMDESAMRRGQPCWYKNSEVGLIAINDAFLLESCVYRLLRLYFLREDYYIDIVNCFHEVTHQTALGQELDLLTSQTTKKVDLDKYTDARYKSIVKYKTAFYSFYLPVALAMYMAGIKDSDCFHDARQLLLELGAYFQIQDDYLDCFGDPTTTGKVGTDIQDGKCSWLVVKALELADEKQRQILDEYYGKKDTAAIERVKQVYKDLNIAGKFKEYEDESYKRISSMIEQHANSLPDEMFMELMDKIYKRNK